MAIIFKTAKFNSAKMFAIHRPNGTLNSTNVTYWRPLRLTANTSFRLYGTRNVLLTNNPLDSLVTAKSIPKWYTCSYTLQVPRCF